MLGITVESNLKMNHHVAIGQSSLINQLNMRLISLKKLVKVSDVKFSIQLANALFHSKLLYGIEIWGLCPKYLLQKIQRLQNKAARITLGISARSLDSATLLRKMNWMSIEQLVEYRISCLIHQVIYTQTPEYIYKMLIVNNQTNTRTTIGNKLGPKPRHIGKTQYSKNQFIPRSYDIYNAIPSIITSIENKQIFQNHLRRYILNRLDLPDPKIFKISGLSPGI